MQFEKYTKFIWESLNGAEIINVKSQLNVNCNINWSRKLSSQLKPEYNSIEQDKWYQKDKKERSFNKNNIHILETKHF